MFILIHELWSMYKLKIKRKPIKFGTGQFDCDMIAASIVK